MLNDLLTGQMTKAFKVKAAFDLEARFGSTVQITESSAYAARRDAGFWKLDPREPSHRYNVLQIA